MDVLISDTADEPRDATFRHNKFTRYGLKSLVRNTWRDIDNAMPGNLFNQSSWIKAWLESPLKENEFWVSETCPDNAEFWVSEMFCDKGTLVGVALFGIEETTIASVIPIRRLHAFRTGNDKVDSVWSEYADFKTQRELTSAERSAWLLDLLGRTKADEISFKVCKWDDVALEGMLNDVDNIDKAPFVNLGDYKAKSSLRRKINQTERFYNSDIRLVSSQETIPFNDILKHKQWHIDKWAETHTPSELLNTSFIVSHQKFAMESTRFGGAFSRTFTVMDGDDVLGVFYILQLDDWAGFYLASIKPIEHNHVHIGLWAHYHIAITLKEEGVAIYDFMAGQEQYKYAFASGDVEVKDITYMPKNIKMTLVNCLRKLR